MWHAGSKGPYAWGQMSPRGVVLCVLSVAVWLGAVVVACTTGTTPECTTKNSMCGPGFDGPPPEGASEDATSDHASDAPMDATPDGTPDVESDGASESGDVADASGDGAPTPCHHITGTGSALVCDYTDDTPSCSSTQKPGSCPKKNLTGCCVTTTSGGTTAVCFYVVDVPDAAIEQTLCTTAGNTWVTTAP